MDETSLAQQVAALVAAQKANTDALRLLLARDPKGEFINGQNYDPSLSRQYRNVVSKNVITPGNATPIVISCPNIGGRCLLNASVSSAVNGLLLRVEISDYSDFRDVPADFATNTYYFCPFNTQNQTVTPATGVVANTNYFWQCEFPITKKFIRVCISNGSISGTTSFNATRILNANFFGN